MAFRFAPLRVFTFTLFATAIAARHAPPPPRPVRAEPLARTLHARGFGGQSFASPSSLWPLPLSVTEPPSGKPCTWSSLLPNAYIPGCADGGYPCTSFPTLAEAQAACAADVACGGVTSQDGGGPPWEPRHGTKTQFAPNAEASYLISNDCHADSGHCFALPAAFAVVASNASAKSDVLSAALARYTAIINTQVARTTRVPADRAQLAMLSVTVASEDSTLRFGVEEGYTLNVTASGATLVADTVWGALRGLETASQLARHVWTTNAAGSLNASFNEMCATLVIDAPRFPVRGLMLDTSRHFMPVSVVKQAIDLAAYLKMNSVRLHLIDETSWSYYVPELPIITNTSAFSPLHVYQPDDLRELVVYGRLRGVVVWPEVDFPSHSQGLLDSLPEMGCLTPGPHPSRVYIDPVYPELWPTMDKIFRPLNDVFPPSYPFHMGGDEVDRNEWATCPSVVQWAAAHGIAPADTANGISSWWYTSMYNWLAAPPYNRVVFAWEDATDAVNGSWVGASTGGLVLEQWNGDTGVWPSDTCSILEKNTSVLVAGPFHDVRWGVVLLPPGPLTP